MCAPFFLCNVPPLRSCVCVRFNPPPPTPTHPSVERAGLPVCVRGGRAGAREAGDGEGWGRERGRAHPPPHTLARSLRSLARPLSPSPGSVRAPRCCPASPPPRPPPPPGRPPAASPGRTRRGRGPPRARRALVRRPSHLFRSRLPATPAAARRGPARPGRRRATGRPPPRRPPSPSPSSPRAAAPPPTWAAAATPPPAPWTPSPWPRAPLSWGGRTRPTSSSPSRPSPPATPCSGWGAPPGARPPPPPGGAAGAAGGAAPPLLTLTDLGSTNGTYVIPPGTPPDQEGAVRALRAMAPTAVPPGATVVFGDTHLARFLVVEGGGGAGAGEGGGGGVRERGVGRGRGRAGGGGMAGLSPPEERPPPPPPPPPPVFFGEGEGTRRGRAPLFLFLGFCRTHPARLPVCCCFVDEEGEERGETDTVCIASVMWRGCRGAEWRREGREGERGGGGGGGGRGRDRGTHSVDRSLFLSLLAPHTSPSMTVTPATAGWLKGARFFLAQSAGSRQGEEREAERGGGGGGARKRRARARARRARASALALARSPLAPLPPPPRPPCQRPLHPPLSLPSSPPQAPSTPSTRATP